ncbi:MAG: hypothetical protein LUG19_13510 [Desulfovibrio sp.]|uniref:hypothetical protein n=1 Tax=Desulfovibrio sp. TaxID=885 RepID=UPI00258EDA01|nr:hypothetical protein [Desulfovibrio sp.]MCD7985244.1 hypothetical protein [Desulfovibrio sp.]
MKLPLHFPYLVFALLFSLAMPNGVTGAEITSGIDLNAPYQDGVDDKILNFLKNKQRSLCPPRYVWENRCEQRNLKYINKIDAQCKLGIMSGDEIDMWWIGYLDGRFNLVTHLGRLSANTYRQGEKFGRTVRLRYEAKYGTQPKIQIILPYSEFKDKEIVDYIKNTYNKYISTMKYNDSNKADNINTKERLDLYEESINGILN